MSNKVVYAIYNDDILMDAVKQTRAAIITSRKFYSIFHGLDKAMGLAPTRLAICSFIYGCIGISFATWMMNYIMIQDWPQDIGGKPSFSYIENMPAFVPIMFEMTVFCSAFNGYYFYMRSKLWPFKQAENPDVRTTDHFLMEVSVNNNEEELISFQGTGTVEVKVIEKH
jgi:hypothetical protein